MYASRVPRRDEDSGTLSAYLREIGKLPRLTVDEERALGARIQQQQDEHAIARLVEANLRFVVACAKPGLGCTLPTLSVAIE